MDRRHSKGKHRPTNSKTINPMLLMTNTDQTMRVKGTFQDGVSPNSSHTNTFYKENAKNNDMCSPNMFRQRK